MNTIQEKDLARLIREGNTTAFDIAFHQYKEILFKHAHRILRDMDDAEDVIQEVYTTLWEKRDMIPEQILLSSYLYGMVRHRVLNRLSREKVIEGYINHALYLHPVHEPDADHFLLEKELADLIESEIHKLPERMQTIFVLSRKEGLSHKEIAALLHITEGTSKLQVSKALKILKTNVLRGVLLLMGT
ncbi:sigma-70 family RNA polymerase sigma factor [Sphingobacterium psychroaquaticum]|uniref:RNA polymerase sigma factor n=1 Tax=Sphingobacterium psychroaquaticum TaxID=561061 RepID=UPI001068E5C6|nr:sigma-70 family RNA polymerase sigma factor [Sphingobacterium psychroaquaticum]QBQ40971.1 sigma-70 family RNA polymerase sigma factor [Sphingobacterium psychroaquaticum]